MIARSHVARPARLGVALAPDRVVVSATGRAGAVARTWSHMVAAPDGDAGPWRALGDTLAAAIREALAALGDARARVSVALLPPLAECRFVQLPGLGDDEVQLVLARDAASWFPGGAATGVVAGTRFPRAGTAADVLAAVAPASLVNVVHEATASAGGAVEAIVPAASAWAAAMAHAWRHAGDAQCRLVVPLAGRVDVVTVERGEPRALRRLPATPDHRLVLGALLDGADATHAAIALAGEPADVAPVATVLAARGTPPLVAIDQGMAHDALALAARGALLVARAPSLVPEALRVERRRLATRGATRRVAAAVGLLAVAAGVGLWGTHRELDAVRARRAELRGSLTGVLATRDTLAMLTDRLATLREAESGARQWSAAVALLAAQLPRDAYLVSLRAEGDSLVVEGAAHRAAPVLDALGRDASVLAVRAQGSIRQETRDDAEQVERFTLSVRLMPEALAPRAVPPVAHAGGRP